MQEVDEACKLILQVRKQKAFLQNVFREKEEMIQTCQSQQQKLQKMDADRMEWQRKIIEAEREKRDLLERMEQECQNNRQSAKKMEKLKRDLEKLQSDSLRRHCIDNSDYNS